MVVALKVMEETMVKSSETLPPSAILPPVSANINRVPIRRYDQYGSANLCALRVLIVEGDYLQARALTTFLRNTGAVVVGPAPTLSRGLLEVEFHEPTFAVLDIQLGENLVFPLADRLHAGSIPYVFFSAPFQDIPARFSKVRRIEKAHGFDHLLSEIIVEQARDRAGLGSEQYGSAMTLDGTWLVGWSATATQPTTL
jgi:CheY-like chemotaxis protein